MYANFFILLLQISLISSLILFALKLGKEALCAFLPLLAICMNLFVLKQITLFGLEVTCSEGLVVGYLLGFNLLQEFFGKKVARNTIWISFFCAAAFMFLTQVHLLFIPGTFDTSQEHFLALFRFFPRFLLASIACFLFVQFFDLTFFGYLKKKYNNKHLSFRLLLSMITSQAIDTVLFSFLALYGIMGNIFHIILFSFFIKLGVILLSTPFIAFVKKASGREQISI